MVKLGERRGEAGSNPVQNIARHLGGMRPRECGAAAGLALIADGRCIFAQIHGVLLGDVGKRGRQRLRRHRVAFWRNRHFQIVPIDAGVAGHQQFEHGLRYYAEREELAFALK